MKMPTNKKDKIEHERLMEMFKRAEKEATRFVKKNSEVEKRLQFPRATLYS